ncbi:MAG: metallophosphoesterase family protein [Actinobacteria bacterium]|nr:metallophosphoesterase family protein [Actinomycetota bacterium]
MTTSLRIGVISDTHAPQRGSELSRACADELRRCDMIIHAGDFSDGAMLDATMALGPPVVAVHGNADSEEVRRRLPATAEVTASGLRIGVTHNAGAAAGRLERLRRRFPGTSLVVFGHSHIPLLEQAEDGFTILNPGSALDRRRQPRHTMAVAEVAESGRFEIRFLAVDEPPGPLDGSLVVGLGA